MGMISGFVGFLLGKGVSLVTGLFGFVFGKAVSVIGEAFGLLFERATVIGGVVSVLWGSIVFLALFGAAVVLRVVGFDDVYSTLRRAIDREDASGTDPLATVRDLSQETVTDDEGSFSQSAFNNATGMTPAEFVHLYVKGNGGRVKQSTLNTCLPWSKSTVSRLLDTLERDEVVTRIDIGRQNLVCVPESLPDHVED